MDDFPFENSDWNGIDFIAEKGGYSPTPPQDIHLDPSLFDRKLLGIPWYECLTVGLVVVVAVGVGGSVAIVCKKCSGMMGRRSSKNGENNDISNSTAPPVISISTIT
jgi:hypothetical protein